MATYRSTFCFRWEVGLGLTILQNEYNKIRKSIEKIYRYTIAYMRVFNNYFISKSTTTFSVNGWLWQVKIKPASTSSGSKP